MLFFNTDTDIFIFYYISTQNKLIIIIIKLNAVPYCTLAVLVVLHFCLLRYFPSTNLVDRVDNCYTSLNFLFLHFFIFIQSRISKSVVISSFCSFLCSFLLSIFFILLFLLFFLFPVLFSPSVYSLYFLMLYSRLHKSLKSGNGTKISNEKWGLVKPRYLENKKW